MIRRNPLRQVIRMKRIAYFGGTFDPVHNGHLTIARSLVSLFAFDRFYFLPAFHAPHKPDRPPTSGYHRFAMLAIATHTDENIAVSTLELDKREKRYTIDTLAELHSDRKSTRLNSSHLVISYAVFCLNKKTHYCYTLLHSTTK